MRMAWTLLIIAGLLEVVWAVGLKHTQGFTKLGPSVITIAAMIVSMAMLGFAVRWLPISVGYAVWTGIGTVGTAIYGFAILGEPTSAARMLFVLMIVGGIVGLKLASGH